MKRSASMMRSGLTGCLFLFIVATGCQSESSKHVRKESHSSGPEKGIGILEKPLKPDPPVFENSSLKGTWFSETDYPNLDFSYEKGKVVLTFDGQCMYIYPTRVEGKSLVVLYDMQEDCTHDIGIKQTFGLKHVPRNGKPFMRITRVNDTILKVGYFYPAWVDSVNALHPDYPCFVTRFYLKSPVSL